MGTAQRDHDDNDDLLSQLEAESEDAEALSQTELQGVEDAEDLLTSQLDDHGADLGLDLETGVEGGLDASTLVDADDDLTSRDDGRAEPMLDDGSSAIDGTGAEDGWMKDSEGDAELYQSDFEEDDADHRDDGGLEGVENTRGHPDPLHDGLDDTALPPLDREDEDATLVDEIERELIRDLDQRI